MEKTLTRSNVALVIPTFNESENIESLLAKISQALPYAYIVIVDDSGPLHKHRVNKIITQFIKSRKQNITYVSRPRKSGRGSAVIEGLRVAKKVRTIQYFFEMDADLAHDPSECRSFLRAIEDRNVDFVVGSRYLPESRIVDWPLRRRILSKIINRGLELLLGMGLTDYTNGFRLYNRKAVEHITSGELKEKGFIVLSEIAYMLKKAGFTYAETPITFTDRKRGKSSVGITELLDSLLGVIRIRYFH